MAGNASCDKSEWALMDMPLSELFNAASLDGGEKSDLGRNFLSCRGSLVVVGFIKTGSLSPIS